MPTERYNIEIGATNKTKEALSAASHDLEQLREEMEGIGDAPLVDRKQLDNLRKLQQSLKSVQRDMSKMRETLAKPAAGGGGAARGPGGTSTLAGAPGAELAAGSKEFAANLEKGKQLLRGIESQTKSIRKEFERAGKGFGGGRRGPGVSGAGGVGGRRGGGGLGGAIGGGLAGGAMGGMAMGAVQTAVQTLGTLEIAGFSVGALAAPALAGVQALMSLAGATQQFMGGQMGAARITGAAGPIRGVGQFQGTAIHEAMKSYAQETADRDTFMKEEERGGRGLRRGRVEWLAGRATALGMEPTELASTLGTATRLMGGEERRRYATYAPPGLPSGMKGMESQVGIVRVLQTFAKEAGFEGPRAAQFMRKTMTAFTTAVEKGQAVSIESVAASMTGFGRMGPRMQQIAPALQQATGAAFGQAGATMGGAPESDFLIRSMGTYLKEGRGLKDVSMYEILNALQGGAVRGKAVTSGERIRSAIGGVKKMGGSEEMQALNLREALKLQGYAPDVAMRILKEFPTGEMSEKEMQAMLDKAKSGKSGKGGVAVRGEMEGLEKQFEELMRLTQEREKLLSGPGAMKILQARLVVEQKMTAAATKAVDGIAKFTDSMFDAAKQYPGVIKGLKEFGKAMGALSTGPLAPLFLLRQGYKLMEESGSSPAKESSS